jgi:hypothetical protein
MSDAFVGLLLVIRKCMFQTEKSKLEIKYLVAGYGR